MSNKEKLIQFIHNLTDEEVEKIISLASASSFEEVAQLLPQNNSPQDQVTAS
jgi:hypothetical protein